ncbi:MAG: helix-turn-helix domain-containing protein [Candidatus Nitrosocaldaceae archaeon]
MISEKAWKAMESLGLTGYEIKVYVTLLNKGAMTAQTLSKESKVPYSKIYEVLDRLQEKGWIEEDSSRPIKFYPKSPTTAIEVTRLKFEEQRKENESILLNELTELYEKTGVKEKPEIWVIRGVYNILARVKEVIEKSKVELLIALPLYAGELARNMQPIFRTMHEKGVKIQVLASENTPSDVIKALSRVSEVRLKDSMFGGGVISDSEKVVILLAGEIDKPGEALAIWAEHAGLARFAREYFQYLWKDASNKI